MFSINFRTNSQVRCQVLKLDTKKVLRYIGILSLKKEGYQIFSVEQAQGATLLDKFHKFDCKKIAIVFGNEVNGVEQTTIDMSDGCLEIPQFGTKHSLNVSVCAGIVVWECFNKLK